MKKSELITKLAKLKAKQKTLDKAWGKYGNREFIQFMVDILPKVVEAERCSIFIYDPTHKDAWVLCGTGVEERQISVPVKTTIVGKVISSGKFSFDNDLQHKVGPHDIIGVQTGFRVHQSLCVPVLGVTTKKVTGAIQALNKVNGSFDDSDREILERTALHIEMTIENLYLRQETQKISSEMNKQIQYMENRLQEHEESKTRENIRLKRPPEPKR